jgi:hypothetical protein
MKLNLRTLVLASAVTATAALASIPALAATAGATLLHVPFSFTVAGKALPAGDYFVKRDTWNFISLQSTDASRNYVWISRAAEKNDGGVSLHFGVDGQNHVLESVQYGALVTPRLANHVGSTEDITPQFKIDR